MAKSGQNKGSRYNLGADVDGLLADYCTAMLEIDASKVMRAALKDFIARELDENSGIKKRFDAAQKERTGATKGA